MKEKRYTSGEIASAAGLTIRTVQHYDNIGLLRSAGRTEGGRRYYTQDDLIRLEQIVLYKSLDFSLDQIKDKLLFQPDRNELLEMFNSQRLLLLQKMEHLHTSFAALGVMAEMAEAGKEIPLTLLLQILSALPEDDVFSKAPQLLTQEQHEMLSAQLQDFESVKQFYHSSKEILIEAMILQQEGLSPAATEAQGLIERWWEGIVAFACGDMELVRELSELNLEEQLITRNRDMLTSAKEFMEAAFEIFSAHNGLVSEMGANAGKGGSENDTADRADENVRR
ncbi:MAG: MerR family transcriptional regulator [Bacillota bacterium]|nr:MerR family transcriptional regulator [Bacillota bacterium]